MKDNLKINFVGSQGTGKTTLLEAARKDEDFKKFKFHTEIVRDLVKTQGLSINESGNVKSQKIFFNTYYKQSQETNYISDRCVLDVCAYTESLFRKKLIRYLKEDNPKEPYKYFRELLREKSLLNVLFENRKVLGKIIYFPIEFDLVDDGVRSLDPTFQKEIDKNIQNLLKEYDLTFYTIRGSVEQRLKQLKEIIFSYV